MDIIFFYYNDSKITGYGKAQSLDMGRDCVAFYYFDREERKGEDYEKVDENDFLYCRLCFPGRNRHVSESRGQRGDQCGGQTDQIDLSGLKKLKSVMFTGETETLQWNRRVRK